MTVLIETVKLPDSGYVQMDLQLTADIRVPAEAARKRVTVLVGREIADLLYGGPPDLVWQEQGVYWRVPVILASRSLGRIGQVGAIDVAVETGELRLDEEVIAIIEDNAQRLAAGAAL
jgi:hypothetical protein